jgi:autotransporter-associated beta strand protein
MYFTGWRKWLKRSSLSAKKSRPGERQKHRRNLQLELLEDRLAPAVRTWTGGVSATWTEGRNWNQLPDGTFAPPTPGADDLLFPDVAQNKLNVNNFPSGSDFLSVTFTGAGYTLGGNTITLGSLFGGSGSITDRSGATTNKITFNIQFPPNLPAGTETFEVFPPASGNNSVLELDGQLSGDPTVNVVKQNLGTLVLAGANAGVKGPVTVNRGVLQIQSSTALGTGNTTTVLGGAALELKDINGTVNVPSLVVGGTGVSQTGVIRNISGNNALAGNVTFSSSVFIGAEANSNLTINSMIIDNGSLYALTKVGPGKVIVTSNNDYTGRTDVNAGVLNLRAPQALGDPAHTNSLVTVNAGALELEGVSVLNRQLQLNGPGIDLGGGTFGGALRNVSGQNTWSGDITLATDASVGADGNTQLTLTGTIRDFGGSKLTKEGTGQVIVTHANTYAGTTVVDQGTLSTSNAQGLGAVQGNVVVVGRATLELLGVSVLGKALALNGPGVNNVGALHNVSGQNTWSGPITLPTDASVGADAGTQLTLSGVISGPGGWTKFLPGEVVVTNANKYLGTTTINAGVVTITNNTALGDFPPSSTVEAGTVVHSGAALQLQGVVGAQTGLRVHEPLSLEGTGVNNTGALRNINGTNILSGDVILTGNTTIGVEIGSGDVGVGSQLTLKGDVSEQGGSFGITKVGPNRLILSGYNLYTGAITVAVGTLTAGSDNALGSASGGGVTVNDRAVLALTGGIQVGKKPLNLTGSGPDGTGSLINAGGDNRYAGDVTLGSNVVISTALNSRLTMRGVFGDNRQGFSLTKSGAGKLVLGGANTYGGGTQILAGILNVQDAKALGSDAAGTSVADGAALEMQVGVNITNQKLVLRGNGPAVAAQYDPQWFQIGPAPVVKAVAGVDPSPGAGPASGRITAIATDPSPGSQTIYIAAAGGGVWKSKNGGKTWVPKTDNIPGLPVQSLFMGSITVSKSNPNVIYAGTGENDWFTPDFTDISCNCVFYGRGILKSTDGGDTWTLIRGNPGKNEFDRMNISKIVVDPTNENIVYAAVSAFSVNGLRPGDRTDPVTGNALNTDGVWKSSNGGLTWVNTTLPFIVMPLMPPGWLDQMTDLVIDPLFPNRLWVAVGSSGLASGSNPFPWATGATNGVWRSLDNGATWTLAGNFPKGPARGNIKLAIENDPRSVFSPWSILYASSGNAAGGLMEVMKTTSGARPPILGGEVWNPTAVKPPDYLVGLDFFHNTIAIDPSDPNGQIVYVAGENQPPFIPPGVLMTKTGGVMAGTFPAWINIRVDPSGNGPHTDHHAMAFDSAGKLLLGNDGGIWRLSDNGTTPTGVFTGSWDDLNSNLAITQLEGLGINPNDPNIAYAGAQDIGNFKYTGTQKWGTESIPGDGGIVRVDPSNPNTVYGENQSAIYRSDDAGVSFTALSGVYLNDPSNFYKPYVLDPSNPSRLLIGTNHLYETTDKGSTFTALSMPNRNGFDSDGVIDAIGLAPNNPNVIYVATAISRNTSVAHLFVTFDHGQSWKKRDIPTVKDKISDITVDPNDPNIAYVTRQLFDSLDGSSKGHVFKTTDGGVTWIDLTFDLPDLPTYAVLLDPRPNPNILYIGTDNGVWTSTSLGGHWSQFGTGIPNTEVKTLILDPIHDYIAVGTHGRGAFVVDLDPVQANAGAMRAITGANQWTGDVIFTQDARIGAEPQTTVTLSGFISDNNTGSSLTKVGPGKVVLSNVNTYGGNTTVNEGVLTVQNQNAMGRGTDVTVNAGATLELDGENMTFTQHLTLSGTGVRISGRDVGALRNVSGFNTWSGPVTLARSDLFNGIGAERNSQLTVKGVINQSVTNANLAKEGVGRVIVAPPTAGGGNTYSGNTRLDAGYLTMQHVASLGTGTGGSTTILAGASLELQFPATGAPFTIAGQAISRMSGTGVNNDGALHLVSGNVTWTGNVTLDTSGATIAVDDDLNRGSGGSSIGDPLTITGVVGDTGGSARLTKGGVGRLILNRGNIYSGGTTVALGALQVQNATALGTAGKGTAVLDGGALELMVSVGGEPLSLSGTGVTGTGALRNISGNNTWSGPVTLQSTSAIGVDVNTTLTVSGGIGGLRTSVLDKVGPGTLIFPSKNTYFGQTLVFAGILNVQHPEGLGDLGGDGTFVADGATLQLQNGITILGKTLQITGAGVGGKGALENLSGNNAWDGQVILNNNATIGVDNAADTLTLKQRITESVALSNLTKVGIGTLVIGGPAGFGDTYLGTTRVNAGTLVLNKTLNAGEVAIPGNLIIGTGTGAPGSAVVQWLQPNQVAGSSNVTVNSDGKLDLNNQSNTIATLTINGGAATTGTTGGTLTISTSLTMTGGSITMPAAGTVNLGGNVTATSAAAGPATISGGTLALGSATRTFTVNAGPQAKHLIISSVISGTGTAGVTKAGTGTLNFITSPETYPGVTTLNAGTLLVDSMIGNVQLAGGTLGGIGTVGTITSTSGSVAPGTPAATNPGTLTSGNATLAGASYFAQLSGTSATPVLNKLVVNGTLNLSGSTLTGGLSITPPLPTPGATFNIIHATAISGIFSNPNNRVIIGGLPFQISYTATDVNLTLVKADTVTTVAADNNPSVFGQPVTFTATVAVTPTGTAIPTGTVIFTVDGTAQPAVSLDATGKAAFSPPGLGLAVGLHTITVSYSGDANFNASSTATPFTQTVNKANTATAVTSSANPVVLGQSVTFTATVSAVAPGAGIPGGTVTFSVDGASQPPVNLDASGKATFSPAASLSVGKHTIKAVYNPPAVNPSYNGSTSADFTQTVVQALTTTTVTSALNPSVFGQSVTFTATVTVNPPGTGNPTGTVTFTIDGAAQPPATVAPSGTATLSIATLTAGSHTVTATYNGDSNFGGSTSINLTQTVNKANTATSAISSSQNPSVFGQGVSFSVTVSAVAPGAGTPGGTATFTIDGVAQPAVTLSNGQATLPALTTLSVGLHTVSVAYNGDANFNASSAASFTQTVNKADTTTTVSATPNPSVFGQSVTFTATVSAAAPGGGTPSGTVTFTVDGAAQPPVNLDATGKATFSSATLAVGQHTITAAYTPPASPNYNASTSANFTQTVSKANTTVAIASSLNPSAFGQVVTFTITASAAAPGAGTPTGGMVTLRDGTTTLGTATLTNGSATISTTATNFLLGGLRTLTATYAGDNNFNGSTSANFTQTVNKANTTTSAVSSSLNPAIFGMSVTFTATVNAVGSVPAAPTGTVSFLEGTNVIGTATLVGNTATFMFTSALGVGTHVIAARYEGDGNFNTSTGAGTLTQTVTKNNSTTTVASGANPSVHRQSVTFTATVAPQGGTGVATGNIIFTVDGTAQPAVPLDATGKATLAQTFQAIGTHTVSAAYGGDNNLNASNSANFTQTVNKANTTTTVSASVNPSVVGQSVTLTATVAAQAPGTGTPTGTVTFTVDGTVLAPVALSNGQASVNQTFTAAGSHTVTASYSNSDGFFNNSATASTFVQTVGQADTATAAVNSSQGTTVYGQAVTFTTSVTVKAPGTGTPTGTVTFRDGGVTLGTVPVAGGSVSFTTTAPLSVGSHSITATYNGDSNFNSSSSPAAFTQVVTKADTNVGTVSSNQSPSGFGQAVTFTVTVSARAPGTGTPTGTVTFLEGTTALGTGTLSGGTASFTTSSLAAGAHSITASYAGDGNFNTGSSTSAFVQVVNRTTTAVAISSSVNPSTFGQSVTFSVTVTAGAPANGVPTGSVTLTVDGGSAQTATLDNTGHATLATAAVPAGQHTITATYNGDSNFGTVSTSITQTVNKANTTLSLASSANPATVGQAVIFTATLGVVAPGAGTSSGTVTFTVDGNATTVSVDGTGKATLTTTSLVAGSHSVTASYGGDNNFNASNSNAVTETVGRDNSVVSLTSSANPADFGATITLTTVVTGAPVNGNTPSTTPTGTVTFKDGNNVLGTVTLTNGQASLNTVLSVGNHALSVTYSGDGNYNAGSLATALAQVVNKANSAVAFNVSRTVAVAGRPVTFTATVSSLSPNPGTPTGTVSFVENGVRLGSVPVGADGTAALTISFTTAGNHVVNAVYSGDDNFNSSTSAATVTVTVGTASQTFVAQAYLDLLRRPADSGGLAFWSRLIDQGTGRTDVVLGIENSTEYRRIQVNDSYRRYLHRDADPVGLNAFVGLLQSGGTLDDLAAILVGSPEYYQARSGNTNEGFLTAMYQDILNRGVDAAGRAYFLLLLQQFTPHNVIATQILKSVEADQHTVDSFYRMFLHRPADNSGLNAFTNVLQTGGREEQVIAALVASDEYFARL